MLGRNDRNIVTFACRMHCGRCHPDQSIDIDVVDPFDIDTQFVGGACVDRFAELEVTAVPDLRCRIPYKFVDKMLRRSISCGVETSKCEPFSQVRSSVGEGT